MAPAQPKPDGLLGLGFAEARILLLGILCTDDTNKLDTEKLAQRAGYKNAASAGTSYRTAKRHLIENNSGEQSAATPTGGESSATNTPKRGRPKKVAAAEADPAEAEEEEPEPTPKKRQRKAPTKKGIAQKIKKDEDAVKSEPSSPKAKVTIKAEEHDEDKSSAVKKEEEVISGVKKEEEDTDDAKTVDQNPMSNEELDAQLDAMKDSKKAVKGEIEDGA
ncbi:hypothetical protein BBP40_008081 [Aspergillus hancockii]|nr:hypothetical protein BBP40_008081 [Aspergillus hancockii]